MVEILMKHGLVALVDDADAESVLRHSWHTNKGVRPYVRSTIKTAEGWRNVLLHRFLLQPGDGVLVDHIDGNPLNNTRSNLRLATPAQNAAHRTRASRGQFIGTYRTASGKWAACISPNGKTKYLGSFHDEESAAAAYNVAAAQFFGAFAGCNQISGGING